MAPHFASELWSLFIRVPNRVNAQSSEIQWESDVLEQSWPKVDKQHAMDLTIYVNDAPVSKLKFTAEQFKSIDLKTAVRWAMDVPELQKYVEQLVIKPTNYVYYPYCHGSLYFCTLATRKGAKAKDSAEQR